MAGNYFMGIKLEDLVNSTITLFLCEGCVLNLSQIILTFIVCFKFTCLTFVISLIFFFFKFFIFGLIGIVCTPLSAGGRGLSKFSERGGELTGSLFLEGGILYVKCWIIFGSVLFPEE